MAFGHLARWIMFGGGDYPPARKGDNIWVEGRLTSFPHKKCKPYFQRMVIQAEFFYITYRNPHAPSRRRRRY